MGGWVDGWMGGWVDEGSEDEGSEKEKGKRKPIDFAFYLSLSRLWGQIP
jgi:hypothetical protein